MNIDDLSYSGIANILDGATKDEQIQFLHQLDNHYNEIKEKQLKLEKELESLQYSRAVTVGGFIHCHKILIQSSDKPLSFVNASGDLVFVKCLENGNMDYHKDESSRVFYEVYPITIKNESQITSVEMTSENKDEEE
jgi:hypothetical protein